MSHCPECRAFFQQACVLRQYVLPEQLQVIALSKEVRTGPRFHQLTIEVNWILDRLVLHGEYLDALHDLIKEKLRKNVAWVPTLTLLTREAEIDAIFHDKEAFLTLRSL